MPLSIIQHMGNNNCDGNKYRKGPGSLSLTRYLLQWWGYHCL
uniref:Uncharacterized protein n=1 Tax=Rhizophora mucronata TaxID=61149 RepID=A0A2P2PTJ7_RHIMU